MLLTLICFHLMSDFMESGILVEAFCCKVWNNLSIPSWFELGTGGFEPLFRWYYICILCESIFFNFGRCFPFYSNTVLFICFDFQRGINYNSLRIVCYFIISFLMFLLLHQNTFLRFGPVASSITAWRYFFVSKPYMITASI